MNYFRLIILAFCLLFSPLVWAMGHLATQDVSIGKKAPDAVLVKTDGTSAHVIQQGKKEILVFWATWCPHCYEELGTINDNFTSIEQKGFNVVLVDVGEAKEDIKKYFNQRQLKLISYVDENSVLQGPYHLIGVPTLVFIDEKGIICNVTHAFPFDYENYFSIK
jgi:peroxiredoxin